VTVEYRAPRNQDELRDAIECSARAFEMEGDEFINTVNTAIRYVNADPLCTLDETRVCFLNGKAVSFAQILNRQIRIGNCIIKMGGLAGVGSDLNHRRAGYSSGVVRDCVRYMQSAGYDLSILYTGIHSHYARAGWVAYPTHDMRLSPPEKLNAAPDGISIETGDFDKDGSELIAIYSQFNETRTGTFVKDAEYWRRQSIWRRPDDTFFWVARRNDKAAAYLIASPWRIEECGYLPTQEDVMCGLFMRFFQKAKTEGVNEINAHVPAEYQSMFESLGCAVRRRENNAMMIRVINLESLVRKVLPLLQARLRASAFSRWEGVIQLRYEGGRIGLKVKKDSRIEVHHQSREPEIDLAVSQEQLLKLLFGNITSEQIAFCNHLTLDESNVKLLDVLFSKGEFFIWHTDRF
jgi:predicted acetyltransferase